MATATPDRLDAAIAGAAAAVAPAPLVQVSVRMSTGRIVGLIVPVDLTRQEALDLVGSIARDLPRGIAEAAGAQLGPALEVPAGIHRVPKA